jgi:hypothetical protein
MIVQEFVDLRLPHLHFVNKPGKIRLFPTILYIESVVYLDPEDAAM